MIETMHSSLAIVNGAHCITCQFKSNVDSVISSLYNTVTFRLVFASLTLTRCETVLSLRVVFGALQTIE